MFVAHLVRNDDVIVKVDQYLTRAVGRKKSDEGEEEDSFFNLLIAVVIADIIVVMY